MPAGTAAAARHLVAAYVPITRWLPAYHATDRSGDLVAGITSWAVMVPVSMAYAELAGVPPQVGLTTAFAALAAYAIFGTSRHLKVTASSTMAVMSAAVVIPLAGGDASRFLALTAALALIVGIILVVGGVLRLGFIGDFLSKPVVTGFVFGLAITILVGQLPKLFGIPAGGGTIGDQLVYLVQNLDLTNPQTLIMGVGSIVLILGMRRITPRIPGPLVALVIGILASTLLDLSAKGVSVVGDLPTGFPGLGLPGISLFDLPFLVVGAGGIVFLAVGESLGAARAFATRHDYEIEPDQELIALGAANLASGLFGGFTADASLSQTATGEAAGTRTQLSSIIASGLILATVVVLAPLFRNLPNSVLAAIVITSVLGLMDVAELRRYLGLRRTDFAISIVAIIGVVTTTVLVGLSIAVALSLVSLLYRASRPDVVVLGRMPSRTSAYANIERHPDAIQVPATLILRLDAPLYFFNANVARDQMYALIRKEANQPDVLVLDIGATGDLDVTTLDMVREVVVHLSALGIDVRLAQVKSPVRDRMRRNGLLDLIGDDHVYLSVADAVRDRPGPAEMTDPAEGPVEPAQGPSESAVSEAGPPSA